MTALLPALLILPASLLAAAVPPKEEPPAAEPAAVSASTAAPAALEAPGEVPAPPQALTPPPEIRFVYPWPGEQVGAVRRIFVFGNVAPATGAFTINGAPAAYTEQGQFLQYVEVRPGTFTITAELKAGEAVGVAVRSVVVAEPPGPPPPGRAEIRLVEPAEDLTLKAGDWLRVSAWANPGGRMSFRVKGLAEDVPMVESAGPDPSIYYAEHMKETPPQGGYYAGAYRVGPNDKAAGRELELQFKHPEHGKAKARAAGRVTADPAFWRVATVQAQTKAVGTRSGSDAGQLYFLAPGTRVLLDGRAGSRWRIRLTETEEAWIDDKNLELMPEGTPPPAAKLETIVVRSSATQDTVEFTVGAAVPAVVTQEAGLVKVTFYHTREHVNWIIYDETDAFVREIRWRQEGAQKATATIHLREGERLWGYSLARTPGRYVLTMRRTPRAGRRTVFENLTVVLDPGHSGPDAAGIGPLGTREQDVNLALAEKVRRRLLDEKARVVMTRTGDEVVPLTRRPEIAVENGGDLFLSLHFNATPAGLDPRAGNKGFMSFFYHPQSLELARELQLSYRERVPLPSEGFRFGDYHVIRMTEMPAALIESAYIMLPEQESLIRDPRFQDKLAQAVVEGLWRFLRRNLREPEPREAPQPRAYKPRPQGKAGLRRIEQLYNP